MEIVRWEKPGSKEFVEISVKIGEHIEKMAPKCVYVASFGRSWWIFALTPEVDAMVDAGYEAIAHTLIMSKSVRI
jgi:hypothetical protein